MTIVVDIYGTKTIVVPDYDSDQHPDRPKEGQSLTWDSDIEQWVPLYSASAMYDLLDVSFLDSENGTSILTHGSTLSYDSDRGKWIIGGSSNDLDSEVQARKDADSDLKHDFDSDMVVMKAFDSDIRHDFDSDILVMKGFDSDLRHDFDSDMLTLKGFDSDLRHDFDSDVAVLMAADSDIRHDNDSDHLVLIAKDSDLQSDLDSEIQARKDADSDIIANLDSDIAALIRADSDNKEHLDSDFRQLDSELRHYVLFRLDSEIHHARKDMDSDFKVVINSYMERDSELDSDIRKIVGESLVRDSDLDVRVTVLENRSDVLNNSTGRFTLNDSEAMNLPEEPAVYWWRGLTTDNLTSANNLKVFLSTGVYDLPWTYGTTTAADLGWSTDSGSTAPSALPASGKKLYADTTNNRLYAVDVDKFATNWEEIPLAPNVYLTEALAAAAWDYETNDSATFHLAIDEASQGLRVFFDYHPFVADSSKFIAMADITAYNNISDLPTIPSGTVAGGFSAYGYVDGTNQFAIGTKGRHAGDGSYRYTDAVPYLTPDSNLYSDNFQKIYTDAQVFKDGATFYKKDTNELYVRENTGTQTGWNKVSGDISQADYDSDYKAIIGFDSDIRHDIDSDHLLLVAEDSDIRHDYDSDLKNTKITDLLDVTLYDSDSEGVENFVLRHNYALAWDSEISKWRPKEAASRVANLLDVTYYDSDSESASNYQLKDGYALSWDSELQKWNPKPSSSTIKGLTDFNDSDLSHYKVIVWDSDENEFRGGELGSSTLKTKSFTATGSQTDFDVSDAIIGKPTVARNGATLLDTQYTVDGSVITYQASLVGDSENLDSDDEITITYMTGSSSTVMYDSVRSMKDVSSASIGHDQVLVWDSETNKFTAKNVTEVSGKNLSFAGNGGFFGIAYTKGDELMFGGNANTDRVGWRFNAGAHVEPVIKMPNHISNRGKNLETKHKFHVGNMFAINDDKNRISVYGCGDYRATGGSSNTDRWEGTSLNPSSIIGSVFATQVVEDIWVTDHRGTNGTTAGKCTVLAKIWVPESSEYRYVAWGYNNSGLTGTGLASSNESDVRRASALDGKNVIDAFITHTQSYVLCSDGTIYGAGNNTNGELGIGNNTANITTFTQMVTSGSAMTDAVEMSISYLYGTPSVFVRTSTGEVFATGRNSGGELAVGDQSNKNVLTPVLDSTGTALTGTKKIEAGYGMIAVIGSDDKLYLGGVNHYSQAMTTYLWADGAASPNNRMYVYGMMNDCVDINYLGDMVRPLWFFTPTDPAEIKASGADSTDQNESYLRGDFRWFNGNFTTNNGILSFNDEEYPTEWFRCGYSDGTINYGAIAVITNKNRIWGWGRTDSHGLCLNVTPDYYPTPTLIYDPN